jgi:CheY-like chemotaxis protein
MSLAGNLRDLSLAEVLDAMFIEKRSGVLRLKQSGPDGHQRGDLVLFAGKIHGAALYRAGGVRGMADALVAAALCSPEDAAGATLHAGGALEWFPGGLEEGAGRVGVGYEHVVEILEAHIVEVADELKGWRSGTYEFVVDGFPQGAYDRDSAAARSFLLDTGVEPRSIPSLVPPTSRAAGGAPAFLSTPSPSAPSAVVEPLAKPAMAGGFVAPPTGVRAAVPIAEVEETDPEISTEPTVDDPAGFDPSAEPAVEDPFEPPTAAPLAFVPPPQAPAPEPEPEPETDSDSDFKEDGEPDEGFATGADYSTPGFGEAALMEAETLLDSEVLSVMLEMGNSAAAAAAIALSEESDRIRTGHLVIVDDDGELALLLVPALRDAGYLVHSARGVEEAIRRLATAAAEGERPLVLCDLLLARVEGGLTGGIDVAAVASALVPAPPVLLLAETSGDEVRSRAMEAGVAALITRPLRSELKILETRDRFVEELLVHVDEQRPRAEWRVESASSSQASTSGWRTAGSGSTSSDTAPDQWDVDGLHARAAEVEDLPELAATDSVSRQDALWRETMRELAGPLSPPEILLQILRFGAEVLTRGVLFTPSGKDLKGFGQFGVELAPGTDPDEAVRQIRLPSDEHPGIRRAVEERMSVRLAQGDSAWESYLSRALGGRSPEEVFLGPVFCQGRLAGLLYGDTLPSHAAIPDTTNLEVVLGQAGLALDRDLLEARIRMLEAKGNG